MAISSVLMDVTDSKQPVDRMLPGLGGPQADFEDESAFLAAAAGTILRSKTTPSSNEDSLITRLL